MKTRKPQSSSVLDGLKPEQEAQLEGWLLEENRSYEEVRDLVAKEFGVQTSPAALCRYYQRWFAPRLVAEAAGETADPEVWEGLKTGCIEEASIGRARQLGFSALTMREPDVKAVARLFTMVNAVERVKLARERVALEQRRVAIAEKQEKRATIPMGEFLMKQELFTEVRERMNRGETLAGIMTGWLEGRIDNVFGGGPKAKAGRGKADRPRITRIGANEGGAGRPEGGWPNADRGSRNVEGGMTNAEGGGRNANGAGLGAGPGGERSTFAEFAAELRALHEEREREEREEIEAEAEELQSMREEIVALEAELANAEVTKSDGGARNVEGTNLEGGARKAEGSSAEEEARAAEIEKMTFDECLEHLKTLDARKRQRDAANAERGTRKAEGEVPYAVDGTGDVKPEAEDEGGKGEIAG